MFYKMLHTTRPKRYFQIETKVFGKILKENDLEEDDAFVSYVTALFTSVLCDVVVDIAVD